MPEPFHHLQEMVLVLAISLQVVSFPFHHLLSPELNSSAFDLEAAQHFLSFDKSVTMACTCSYKA